MPEDLSLLIEVAEAAGDIALRHFAGDRAATEKPGGQGPVTEADLEVDGMLRERLLTARPDYGWLSEETPDTEERLSRDRVFISDPIDGTRAFIDGQRAWAHSIAIAEQGAITAAVVYLPAKDRLYAAALGHGARLNGVPIAVDPKADEAGELLATRSNLHPDRWPGGVTPMRPAFRSSIANRLALVAAGRFSAMLSFREVWEWDIAAGALIASEAGARVSTHKGSELVFNSSRGKQDSILVAPPALHGTLLDRLTPAPA